MFSGRAGKGPGWGNLLISRVDCVLQLVQGKISQQQYVKDRDHQQKRQQQLIDEVEAIAQQLWRHLVEWNFLLGLWPQGFPVLGVF